MNTDCHETSIKFINSMEMKNYPIWSTMYHPEYQMLQFYGAKRWNLAKHDNIDLARDVEEIAFRISLKLNREARKNMESNYPRSDSFYWKHAVTRIPAQTYPVISSSTKDAADGGGGGMDIMAYGYNNNLVRTNTHTS